MELITILNRCHRFRGFVYQHAHFSAGKKSIEVAVRPRNGYDQLAERRFEFIPLWGFLAFLLYTMRRVDCLWSGNIQGCLKQPVLRMSVAPGKTTRILT